MPVETILVIDDSPTILKVVGLVLTKSGYHLVSATTGAVGIEEALHIHPDAILLDFSLPDMDATQVCRTLEADPDAKNIPVIIMSAKGEPTKERFVSYSNVLDFITKPFSPEAITAVIQHTIEKHKG